MTLAADEFQRRFLLHVLPQGFVRIRFFGFLANRHRTVPRLMGLNAGHLLCGATSIFRVRPGSR